MAGRFSVDAVFRGVDHLSRTFVWMSANISRFSRGLHRGLAKIEGVTGRVEGGFGRIIRYASLAGTAMAGLAARDIMKTGMDFEAQMSAVGATGLKTREEIGALTAEAKRLGATTKFTATEAAAGMEIMAKAGYKEKDILTGISGVLNAAAASGQDLAETADHVSNVLKGMGMATSEAGKVADMLALASSRTNSTIGSLGESMRNVSAVARKLNIPLEQVVAAVASLQDVGLDASVAGSATATMLTKLVSPSDTLRAKLKGMGVAFEDAKDNMLPFPAVLANLAKMADKAGGNAKQVAAFAELMGLRGQKAGLLLQDLARKGKLEALVAELEKAAGVAEEMAKLRLDNLAGDVTLFKSALDGLETKLYEVESGPLRKIVQRTTKWIQNNEKLITQKFSGIMDELRPLAKIFSEEFMATLRGITSGFETMWKALGKGGDKTKMLSELAKNLGQLAAITVGVLAAFGALAAGIVVGASEIWSSLRGLGQQFVEGLGGMIQAVTEHWANIKAIWNNAGLTLKQKTYQIGRAVVHGVVDGIKSMFKLADSATFQFGSRTVAALKRALGIKSPSKPGREMGANIGSSVASGMLSAVDKVRAAWLRLMKMPPAPVVPAVTIPVKVAEAPKIVAPPVAYAVVTKVPQMLREHQDRLARERAAARGPYKKAVPSATAKAIGGAKETGTGEGTRWVAGPGGMMMPDVASELQKTLDMLGTQTGDQTSMMSDLQKSISSLGNLGDLGALTSEQADSQASIAESMQRAADAQEQLTKLLTPGERVSRSVAEIIHKEKVEAEVTIKDETGKAHVTKSPKGKGFGIRVQPSGAF